MNIGLATMEGLKALYQVIRSDRRKERYEMILEPFQALTQLALLSFCPVGSRLAISNNLLSIQTPSFATSITRSYYQDCRDDLVYLFSVITRFYKFYNYLVDKGGESERLFCILVELGKKGLELIIQTYANSGHGSLIQQLKMYKAMLDRSDLCWHRSGESKSEDEDTPIRDEIDGIFIQIRDLYDPPHIAIVLNLFELMKENPTDYITYMEAMNATLKPTCIRIQKWIHSNIVL